MILQKLDYMHDNPCNGKWKLVESPVDYIHSSAKYYLANEQGVYAIDDFMMLDDIDLSAGSLTGNRRVPRMSLIVIVANAETRRRTRKLPCAFYEPISKLHKHRTAVTAKKFCIRH